VAPGRFIVMGRILAPFGVKGWVKVETFGDSPDSLIRQRKWWIGGEGDWKETGIAETQLHGKRLVARIEGCETPEAAIAFRGREIALPRDALPPTRENEFYQADLIGLEVWNLNDERLGTVTELFNNGAHEIMRVAGDEGERLLPFIPQVVREVDMDAARIRVDWGKDW
jgi:16S rRNA processing protein RimM